MALAVRINFFILIFTSVTVLRTEGRLRRYVPLISDVRELYRTFGVCLLLPHRDEPFLSTDALEFDLAYNMTREFSRNGVRTEVIRYGEGEKLLRGKQKIRSLMVVLLTSVDDLRIFTRRIGDLKVSRPIWLLIFTDEFGPAFCDYCKKPTGNDFGLRFDTEMLVVCCKDTTVNEWWGIQGNETKTGVFGERTASGGFELIANRRLYARRSTLDGVKFRAVLVTISPENYEVDGSIGGYYMAVVNELQRLMNFELEIVTLPGKLGPSIGYHNYIDHIARGEADIGVGGFSVTPERLAVVDFTSNLLESSFYLLVGKPDGSEIRWSSFVKVFTRPLWITIIILMAVTSLILTLTKMKESANSLGHVYSTNFLDVWGIFCGQALHEFPAGTLLRILYCATFIVSVVLLAAYGGALSSIATVSKRTLPFSTFEGFANDGSYGIITFKNTVMWDIVTTGPGPVVSKLRTLLRRDRLPTNTEEAFQQVCTTKVGLLAAIARIDAYIFKQLQAVPCEIVFIDSRIFRNIGLPIPRGSQYTGIINYHIQRFRQTGGLARLVRKYGPVSSKGRAVPTEVYLETILPLLCILLLGTVVGAVVLVCEKLYDARCNARPKQRGLDKTRTQLRRKSKDRK